MVASSGQVSDLVLRENLACHPPVTASIQSILGATLVLCTHQSTWYIGVQPDLAFICYAVAFHFRNLLSKVGYFWVSFWRQLGGNFYTDLATLVDKGSSCGYVMMKPSDAIHQSAQSSSQSTNC